jgi:hypothetical protein
MFFSHQQLVFGAAPCPPARRATPRQGAEEGAMMLPGNGVSGRCIASVVQTVQDRKFCKQGEAEKALRYMAVGFL